MGTHRSTSNLQAVMALRLSPSSPFRTLHNIQSTQLFLYRAVLLSGQVNLERKELVDHVWVTRDEMNEYLQPDLLNVARDIVWADPHVEHYPNA